MASIFLSHASVNNAEGVAIRDWMAEEGWDDVFLDLDPERGIKAGERWQEALKRASATCELVIFLVSPDWVASKWCLAEFLLAKQMNKRILGAIVAKTPFEKIPAEMTGEWQMVDLTTGHAQRALPALLPGEREARVVHFGVDGLGRLRLGLVNAGLEPKYFPWPPEHDPRRSPYPGLRAFQEEDAGIFFGREGAIVEGLDLIRGLSEAAPPRMLVILGASGAGKSSYMRAGLLPRIARDTQRFRVLPVIRPDRDALEGDTGLIATIEAALRAHGRAESRAAIRAACEDGIGALKTLLAPIIATAEESAPQPMLIMPIDQGEELFQAEGARGAKAFLDFLAALLDTPGLPALALVAIRSESYEPMQSTPALVDVPQTTYGLAPMPRGAYGAVILGPARRYAEAVMPFGIDDALVDALLADIEAGEARDALPLLAFTLERLYSDYGGSGCLTLKDYEATGRIAGAIAAAVKGALAAADRLPGIPQDPRARLALLRRALIPVLAGVDPDTGIPRRRVARLDEITPEALPLIQLLIDRHLLATDRRGGVVTVEPAHEALLRQWDVLAGWLAEEAEDLGTAEATRRAARDWEANGRDDAWAAHAGGRLQEAERVAAREDFAKLYTPATRAYLAACRALEEARRRAAEAAARQRRNIFAGAFALSLALLALAGWQWLDARSQQRIAEQRLDEAQRSQSLFLAQMANEALKAGDGELATLTALEGVPDTERGIDRPVVREAITALERGLHALPVSVTLAGHEGPAIAVAQSSRAGRVVTASADGTARLWDDEGGLIATLKGHEGAVLAVAFAPDGTRLATAGRDGTVRLWDAVSGTAIAEGCCHAGAATALAFFPAGERLATAGSDGALRLWDARDGGPVTEVEDHTDAIWAIAVGPKGDRLATGSEDGTALLRDAATGATILRLSGHAGPVRFLAFSPDGARIVTASGDGTARIWETATGETLVTLSGHGGRVRSARFSADGERVLTASADNTARLWNALRGTKIATLAGHAGWVRDAVFLEGDTRVLTISEDGKLRLWDGRTGRPAGVLAGHDGAVRAIAVDPAGTVAATGSDDGTGRIWRLTEGAPAILREEPSFTPYVQMAGVAAALSPDGNRVAIPDGRAARILDTRTGKEVARLESGSGEIVRTALFSPDGRHVVTASGPVLRVWEAESGRIAARLALDEGRAVSGPVFAPNGQAVLATVSRRGGPNSILLWAWQEGPESVTIFHGPGAKPVATAISPDGAEILTVSDDSTAAIRSRADPKAVVRLTGHEGPVRAAVFSPDGTRVATASWERPAVVGDVSGGDRTARIWDATTGRQLAVLSGHGANVFSAQFSPNGTQVVTAGADGTARIWDVGRGIERLVLSGHDGPVRIATFAPGGRRVLTASEDGTARLWDAASGAPIAIFGGHGDEVVLAAFSADGSRIVTASRHVARLWPGYQTLQSMVDAARNRAGRCLTPEEREAANLPPRPADGPPCPPRQPAGGADLPTTPAPGDLAPAEFSERWPTLLSDRNLATFLTPAGRVSFRPDAGCSTNRTAVLVAKLRIALSDLTVLTGQVTWAVQPLTAHLAETLAERSDWAVADPILALWLLRVKRMFPSLTRDDIVRLVDELLTYRERITAMPEWGRQLETAFEALASDSDPYDYQGPTLHTTFHGAGFPVIGDDCALASVSSAHPGFANEDIQLSNEGWLYSFWARRHADGSFQATAALLEAIRRTLLF